MTSLIMILETTVSSVHLTRLIARDDLILLTPVAAKASDHIT
jgi:hypothetical protein